jgi:hypothetical protein
MNPIHPIHPKAQGPAVANLHECLLFLVHNQPGISDADRGTLERGLGPELHEQLYKDWTAHLVSLFQEQLRERFGLFVNGNVDRATADALNRLLAEPGAPIDGVPDAPLLDQGGLGTRHLGFHFNRAYAFRNSHGYDRTLVDLSRRGCQKNSATNRKISRQILSVGKIASIRF